MQTDSVTDDKHVNYDELFFNYAQTESSIIPPYTNRGGNIPTTVLLTHTAATGNTNPPLELPNCHIDYLSFSHPFKDTIDTLTQVEDYIAELPDYVPDLSIFPEKKGYSGYTSMYRLTRNGKNIGMVCYGGNNNTCFTSLSGQGCVGLDLFKIKGLLIELGAKLTRVDLAHDDIDGLITVEQYKTKYEQGEFTTGGRPPNPRFIDDMGSGKGKTLYVGSLKNGKEVCIYEKGKQLGDILSPWVRVEGRFSSQDRVIPYDILTEPHQYLAAMYPPLGELSDKHTRIATIKKHADIALKAMIEYAAMAYGKLVNLMSELGHTDSEIVHALKREGTPKRVQVPMDMWAAQYVEDDRPFNGHIPAWMA